MLLECTAAGFATCTLTHMIELHDSREMVRRITGRRAEPQVLIRVGRAPRSARRLIGLHGDHSPTCCTSPDRERVGTADRSSARNSNK